MTTNTETLKQEIDSKYAAADKARRAGNTALAAQYESQAMDRARALAGMLR